MVKKVLRFTTRSPFLITSVKACQKTRPSQPAPYPHQMEFECEQANSETNRLKHGIDFVQAQELWKDLHALQIQAKSETEPRIALIASMQGRVWNVFFTEKNSKIRIISARRSRINEEDFHHDSRAT
ncbi:MAG: BrnT family toxin [Verrucomicrobiota bacterium]